jgi:phosphonate transport system substrate-binding protein
MRTILKEQEKIRFTSLYVKTHTNVYRHVLLGKTVAGGGINNTFNQEPAEVRAKLRVLLETPGVPPHPLSAHPRVPAAVRQSVSEAMLNMASDPVGRTLLKNIQIPNPVAADYVKDYQPLEKFRLEQSVVRENQS